eukprot:COSAG02_NODE_53787_length_299_cov_1.510000_1_plen_26_part_10
MALAAEREAPVEWEAPLAQGTSRSLA